jgi:hypothetical protein
MTRTLVKAVVVLVLVVLIWKVLGGSEAPEEIDRID